MTVATAELLNETLTAIATIDLHLQQKQSGEIEWHEIDGCVLCVAGARLARIVKAYA